MRDIKDSKPSSSNHTNLIQLITLTYIFTHLHVYVTRNPGYGSTDTPSMSNHDNVLLSNQLDQSI
jgi:hypothetical protein